MTRTLEGLDILIAEDDDVLREGLVQLLSRHGAHCVSAPSGQVAFEAYLNNKPDFCIVDIMMEGMDGYQFCAAIRSESGDMPILILSARRLPTDRIRGLEIGADDYMVKPFDPDELIARIRTIMRRSDRVRGSDHEDAMGATGLQFYDLMLYPDQMEAMRDGVAISMTKREVRMLQLLYINRGRVTSRDALLDFCWGLDHLPNSRALDQAIAVLRKKIEADPLKPVIIMTVRGGGYRFDAA